VSNTHRTAVPSVAVAWVSTGAQFSPTVAGTSVDCDAGGDGTRVSDGEVVGGKSGDGADGGAVPDPVVGGDGPTRMSGAGSAGGAVGVGVT
jgi:hypothetical protein